MSNIRVQCIDQAIGFLNTPVISSGNVNYDTITFEFCSKWDGFGKTAIFYRTKDEVYYQILDESNTCNIPNEVLGEKGVIYIGVFGSSGDTTITSQVLKYRIDEGAVTEDLKPSDPTPDIYDQIVAKYGEYNAKLNSQIERMDGLEERLNSGVGDAEKLGGQLPSYYATAQSVADLEGFVEESISESLEAIKDGTTKVGKASEADNALKLETLTAKEVGASGARNLIPYPYYHTNRTQDGIVFTVDDGTITANGTATKGLSFWLAWASADKILKLDKTKTYTVSMFNNLSSNYCLSIRLFKEGDTISTSGGTLKTLSTDVHSYTFTGYDYVAIYIYFYSGVTAENLVFKPMLEFGPVAHDYVPYNSGGADTLDGLNANEIADGTNLLVNPDFAINTSGKTEYTEIGYTVDKWQNNKLSSVATNGKVEVLTNGVKLTSGGTRLDLYFRQYIDNGAKLTGKTVTISVMLEELSGSFYIGQYGGSNSKLISSNGISSYTFTWLENNVNAIHLYNNTGSDSCIVRWVKLELGKQATPFSPPNPEVEKLKCGGYTPVVPTNVDPGVGASVTYADGTVIFVYEEE